MKSIYLFPAMLVATLLLAGVEIVAIPAVSRAEEIGPGKFGGMVIFDRWDACYLYRGIHVMHVSEKIKESLRPLAGRHVQLDVVKLHPVAVSDDDALIEELRLLRDAPGFGESPAEQPEFQGLKIASALVVGSSHRPRIKTTLSSKSKKMLHLPGFHPILLTRAPEASVGPLRVTDGPSIDLSLPILFYMIGDDGRPRADIDKKFWRSKLVDMNHTLKQWPFELQPDAPLELTFEFNLPPGEYQVFFGYQTGQGHDTPVLYSTPLSFDVEKPESRPTE